MEKDSRIYLAGSTGLVGSAIERKLRNEGYWNIITKTSRELDLRRQNEVEHFFGLEQPEYVILAAAKVGGIQANIDSPAEFLYDNLMIEANVINSAFRCNVRKLLYLGSSCVYPKESKQPIVEEYLLSGRLEPTNEGYAIAKIAGLKLCEYYKRQHGCNFISAMPANIYGENDNFNPSSSHVIPAMIRRFYEACIREDEYVRIWGSGEVRREFLHSDDLADACLFLLNNYDGLEHVNVGTGKDIRIIELADKIRQISGFKGEILNDPGKPEGMMQKLLDVTRLHNLGWHHKIELEDGLVKTYKWFEENKHENSIRA